MNYKKVETIDMVLYTGHCLIALFFVNTGVIDWLTITLLILLCGRTYQIVQALRDT